MYRPDHDCADLRATSVTIMKSIAIVTHHVEPDNTGNTEFIAHLWTGWPCYGRPMDRGEGLTPAGVLLPATDHPQLVLEDVLVVRPVQ